MDAVVKVPTGRKHDASIELVKEVLRFEEMPPADEPQPSAQERALGIEGYLYARCGGIFGVAGFVDRCMDNWMADSLPGEHRRDVLILEAMAGIYWRLLEKMRKIDFDVLSDERQSIRLGKWSKLAIGMQTKFAVRFKSYHPVYARQGLAH